MLPHAFIVALGFASIAKSAPLPNNGAGVMEAVAAKLLARQASACTPVHTIVAGDTGYDLSQECGFSLQDLFNDNPGVNWTDLQVGSTIILPVSTTSAPTTATATAPATTVVATTGAVQKAHAPVPMVSSSASKSTAKVVSSTTKVVSKTTSTKAVSKTTTSKAVSKTTSTTTAHSTTSISSVKTVTKTSAASSTTSTKATTTSTVKATSSSSASKSTASTASPTTVTSSITNTAKLTGTLAATPGDYYDGTAGSDSYTQYTGDGSTSAGWPALSAWASYHALWVANAGILGKCSASWGVADNTAAETSALKSAIETVAAASGVDHRFILAIIMQESGGCVRVITTNYGVNNPGLMQDHNGSGTCNEGGTIQNPCPASEIQQMIVDGTQGTDGQSGGGDGLVQVLTQAQTQGGSGAQAFYMGARIYNSGSIAAGGDLGAGGSTHCYASDIANRLLGWATAASKCTLN